MSASTSDKFKKLGGASSLVNSPKVTSVRSASGTTLAVDNCNWDQTTGKVFATYQVDTSNNVVSGTEIIWKGVVTSTTAIGSLERVAGASDSGNAIGDIVELLPASAWANDFVDGMIVEHNQDGTHSDVTATSVTTDALDESSASGLTLKDSSGNEYLKTSKTASAVNELTIANAATGNAPQISATGGDTNIDLKISGKGTGRVIRDGAGAAVTANVTTSETTTSTTFADLATTGPAVTVTIGTSGMALVAITGQLSNSNKDQYARMGFAVSGASTVAASDLNSMFYTAELAGAADRHSGVFLISGLTAGSNTFTAKYRVSANTGTFLDRMIAVIPL